MMKIHPSLQQALAPEADSNHSQTAITCSIVRGRPEIHHACMQAPGAASSRSGGRRERRVRGSSHCGGDTQALARLAAVASQRRPRQFLHHPQRHLQKSGAGVALPAGVLAA
jgi:hypothetical protein